MADSTLNRFVATGTTAERTAFTPTPPSPASGPDPGYFWWDTDTQTAWSWDAGLADWVELGGGGAGGGLVLLEQHTASASASLNFTTCITSTYDSYFVVIENLVPATNATDLYLRFSTDGGSSYVSSASYDWGSWLFYSGGSGTGGGTSQTEILLNHGGSFNHIKNGTSGNGYSGSFYIHSPLGTTGFKRVRGQSVYMESSANVEVGTTFSGTYKSTTAANAFQMLMSSGNITSGVIRVYGLEK